MLYLPRYAISCVPTTYLIISSALIRYYVIVDQTSCIIRKGWCVLLRGNNHREQRTYTVHRLYSYYRYDYTSIWRSNVTRKNYALLNIVAALLILYSFPMYTVASKNTIYTIITFNENKLNTNTFHAVALLKII